MKKSLHMALFPIAGIGLTPPHSEDTKKFSSSECLEALIEKIRTEPEIVRNQVTLLTKEQSGEMQQKFWPALLDSTQWTRLSTHRPKEDDEGEKLYCTDREVREYENDLWADEGRTMKAYVTTEFGEITEFKVVAQW